jgi:agmatinase
MKKSDKIRSFDPNNPGDKNNNLYGLPFDTTEAEIIILPVPWEVTVSYGSGTANGPAAIFDASFQVDLYDPLFPDLWKAGIAMDTIPAPLARKSKTLRKEAEKYISMFENGKTPAKDPKMKRIQAVVNKACEEMNLSVKQKALGFLKKGKVVGLLGGDHSTPLGLMQAYAEHHGSFGILQIDAHADLRDAYEGFTYSHASIMTNALKIKKVEKLVQVGIRDYCEEEVNVVKNSNNRIVCFYDRDIKKQQYDGVTWDAICVEIIKKLPESVYISFDIDGLDPKMCPNTGTPVAGGFEFEQVCYLIEKLAFSGKKIIGFDLNEVTPSKDEWDANVGARLLYRLAGYAAFSNGKIKPREPGE